MTTSALVRVPCRVCGADDAEPAYTREQETGSALGRLHVELVLCRGCGFLYQSPRPSRDAIDAYYRGGEHVSGATWHEVGQGSRHGRLTERRVAFAGRLLASEGIDPGAFLDVGCGRGDLLAALDLPGWRLVGLEPSPAAAAVARGRGIEVVAARLGVGDPPGEAFDAVACISVLEHLYDPRAGAEGLARLVRPGGLLFVEVPDSTRPQVQVAEFYSFEHLSHFTRGTLGRLLASVGFEIVRVERDGSGLRACARRVAAAPVRLDPIDDRAELVGALADYESRRRELERDLAARLGPRVELWRREGARVAIFGGGIHTRFLLDLLDFGDCVAAILDSDPEKAGTAFLRWRIHPVEAAPLLALDAIVISSRAYQDEMLAAVSHLRDGGTQIVPCYG